LKLDSLRYLLGEETFRLIAELILMGKGGKGSIEPTVCLE